MNPHRLIRIRLAVLLVGLVCWSSAARADRPGWQRQEVDWRMTGGARIKAVNYPQDKPTPLLSERDGRRPTVPRKKALPAKAASRLAPLTQEPAAPIIATVFDSPPIDGFVPWIAVSVTDASGIPYEFDAIPEAFVTGNYLTSNPQADYAIGLFDTGASGSLMSNAAAMQAGLFDADLVTSATIVLTGATGDAEAWVSQPLGLFIDGLSAIDPDSLLLDDSNMVGESNVSIIVGDAVASPNLPTAIGSPLAVFCSAAFRNDRRITITRSNNEFTAPDIRFYENWDSRIPDYPNKIYMELRPPDVMFVQYFPCIYPIWECPDGDGSPLIPTIINDAWFVHQGLFYVYATDLTHGSKSATEKKFMFDTGAQVTVIGEVVAARLQLNIAHPDFTVEIQGVTGDTITAPGFYVDLLEITATPEWLSFTNVPIVVLDIDSPEGGYLDGIIGMNLFVDLNFVFHGGGLTLYGQDPPFLKFEPIYRIIADIAPEGGDGAVNFLDLGVFVEAWLATGSMPPSADWNPICDMAPLSSPDSKIDFLDFAVLAEHWFEGTTP